MLEDTLALDGGFAGELIGPDHAAYDRARRVWNGTVDRRPALIARCGGAGDVASALAFARERGLPVAVRGGGHNVAGNAVCDDGIVIDLSGMKAISVDPERRIARVGPGVVLGEIDAATQRIGLATPTGNVSKTGIAGLTLGGGLGWIARLYGLGVRQPARGRGRHRGRRASCARARTRTPTCSGACAAAAATSAS